MGISGWEEKFFWWRGKLQEEESAGRGFKRGNSFSLGQNGTKKLTIAMVWMLLKDYILSSRLIFCSKFLIMRKQ